MSLPKNPTSWTTRFVAILVVLTCGRVWLGPLPAEPTASAQLPNAGVKAREEIAEIQKTNQLLGEIRDVLKSHTMNVRVAQEKTK